MTTNPILEEIYAAREQLLAQAGGDLQRYLAGVRQRESESGLLIPANKEAAAAEIHHTELSAASTATSH